MVPEISLTPQLENRFKERFGIDIDVWHSKITPKKRKEIWHKCFAGEPMLSSVHDQVFFFHLRI